MNINATSEMVQKEYLTKISASFFKWLKETLLCFELATADQILSHSEYFQKLIYLLSINSEMEDLAELVGLTDSLEILKEIFKILDETFRVRRLNSQNDLHVSLDEFFGYSIINNFGDWSMIELLVQMTQGSMVIMFLHEESQKKLEELMVQVEVTGRRSSKCRTRS